jgi:Asp-tRNA(Asn)/Glu-tRNA(Gln) amidotransferase C subunit
VTADGYPLLKVFTKLYTKQEAEDLTAQDSDRQAFLLHLETEIMHFEKLFRLTTEGVKPLTEPMKDAQLLPRQKDLEKIVRYEAALELQFERKLQQLVAWRREKGEGGEKEAPQPREGGHDEAM